MLRAAECEHSAPRSVLSGDLQSEKEDRKKRKEFVQKNEQKMVAFFGEAVIYYARFRQRTVCGGERCLSIPSKIEPY